MSVGIHEAGQNHLAMAIDLNHVVAIVLQPWILQRIGSTADGNDFSAHTEHRTVFDNSEFLEFAAATWAGMARFRPQRYELADIHQQQWPVWFGLLQVSP